MLTCRRCGASNAPGGQFCVACGDRLSQATADDREVRKIVTVLFCDVTASTALGERLDPESLRRVMSRYFERMREVLLDHGGTVEKFIGDAVMAVFGVPQASEDDALRAVAAAVEMQRSLDGLNDELDRNWGVRLQARVGVNTGEVLAGHAGLSVGHGLVTGDAVNVAARLEQAASPGEILVGRLTHELVRNAVRSEAAPPLRLKGKHGPVDAFRVWDVIPRAPGRARRLDVAIVDREAELELVRSAFRSASEERRAHLVTLVGEAGVGKTRLVAEVGKALSHEAVVTMGACVERGEDSPLAPLGEALRTAAGLRPGDSPAEVTARLASLLAGVEHADLVVERVGPVMGAGGEQGPVDDTAWAVRKVFEVLSAHAPLVVVLEDLHWARPTLLDLVDHVLTWSRGAPLLLLCVGRPELLDQRPWWRESRANVTAVNLEPLSENDSALLVERLLGGAKIAPLACERVIEAAEGNPLFVEEMLGMLVDEGVLQQEGQTWVPMVQLTDLAMPPTIESLLVARIDQLGPRDSEILQRAAVMGTVFSTMALVALCDADRRPEIPEFLLRVARRELIRPERAGFLGGEAFRFRHALIADAGYRMLTKRDRAVLHERFARWLERSAGDLVAEHEELLAHHLEAAYRSRTETGMNDDHARALASRAAELLTAAGRRAAARDDVRSASTLLARAVDLIEPDRPGRGQVLHDLGHVLGRTGRLAEALEALEAAIASAVAAGDDRLEAHALVSARRIKLLTDPHAMADAFDDARRAITVFERLGDETGLIRAWELIARIEWSRGRVSASEEALERAVLHAREAGEEQEEAENLGNLTSVVLFGLKPVDDAIAWCEEALRRAGGRRGLEARTLRALGGLRAMQGDFGSARDLLRRSIATFEDLGQPDWMSAALQVLGFVERLAGDHDAAERALRRCYDLMRSEGDTSHISLTAALLAHTLLAGGRDREAEELTRLSEEVAAEEDVDTQSHWRTARAKVLAARGELDEAVALAREAVRVGRGSELYLYADVLLDAAGVVVQAGHVPEAAALVAEAVNVYECKGDLVSARRARALLGGRLPATDSTSSP